MKLKTLAIIGLMASCSKVDNQRKAPEYSMQSEGNKNEIDDIKQQLEQLEKDELELTNDKNQLTKRLDQLIEDLEKYKDLSDEDRKEINAKIAAILSRVETLETSVASLQTTVANHSTALLDISALKTDMNLVFEEIEELKTTRPTNEDLQNIVDGLSLRLEKNVSRIDLLQGEVNQLDENQSSLLLDMEAMAAWKLATSNFIDTLKRTDISSAVSDLQLWQRNITQPLENMLGWFRTGEQRVEDLEAFRTMTENCFKLQNDDYSQDEEISSGTIYDACTQVREKLSIIKRNSEISEGLARDIEELQGRLAGVEEGSEEHKKLIKSMHLKQIQNRYNSRALLSPCLGEDLRLVVSAKEVIAEHELINEEDNKVTGELDNGVYRYGATCTFALENHYKHLSPIELEALSLPENMVIVLPGLCVGDECQDLFGSYNREVIE